MSCPLWSPIEGLEKGGFCAHHKASVSPGTCAHCQIQNGQPPSPIKAILRKARIGDKVEAAINHLPGIEKHPCKSQDGSLRKGSPCARIKAALNGL